MLIKLIGDEFEGKSKWRGCAKGPNGYLYAIPQYDANRILRIDPRDDSTKLVGPDFGTGGYNKWRGFITGPDHMMYGLPLDATNQIPRFDPVTEEVIMVGGDGRQREKKLGAGAGTGDNRKTTYLSAVVGPDDKTIYFFPLNGKILLYDIVNQVTSFIGNELQYHGWYGAVTANDGYIYCIPSGANRVMRLNPRDQSMTFIGDDLGDLDSKWSGGVLGPDGNVYGMPCSHSRILKIDIVNQSTSFVGPHLGGGFRNQFKYFGSVLGVDGCIYMIPSKAEFVLVFDPLTGVTSTVGESLGYDSFKYDEGVLASNGYVYSTPFGAKQVLKIKSWDNWLYLKLRLLVEQRRAVEKSVQEDDDDHNGEANGLNIAQYFINHTNDDIFRSVIEML